MVVAAYPDTHSERYWSSFFADFSSYFKLFGIICLDRDRFTARGMNVRMCTRWTKITLKKLSGIVEGTKLRILRKETYVRKHLCSTQRCVKVAPDIRRLWKLVTEKYRPTLRGGRGGQNKDFEIRNLLPETPWFNAVEHESLSRGKNDSRRMSDATLTFHCVEPRRVRT